MRQTLSAERLSELEKLAGAATAPPWFAGRPYEDGAGQSAVSVGPFEIGAEGEPSHVEDTILECWGGNHTAEENAAFVAAICTEALDLIAMARERGELLAAAYTMMQFARDPHLIGCTTAFGVYMRRDRAIEVVQAIIKDRLPSRLAKEAESVS